MRLTLTLTLVTLATLSGCRSESRSGNGMEVRADAPADTAAVAYVRQRFAAHFRGSQGFGIDTLRARRAWFTPCLYSLLLADMTGDSARGGIGYLDWDPFTAAQDDATGFHIEGSERRRDTVLVHLRISYPGTERAKAMTVAATPVKGEWRIANIITPDANLATGLDSSLRAEAKAGTRTFAGCTR